MYAASGIGTLKGIVEDTSYTPKNTVDPCGRLTLARCQVPTKATLSFPSAGQGRANVTKGSWVEIRTGRDHSPVTVTDKPDLTQGN